MGYIYKVTNTINGKIYVGQTIRTIKKRWKQHVYSAYHETKEHNAPIQCAIRKYGECAFLVEEIEQCNNKDLDVRERYWIKELKACEHGYNISLGGLGWTKCDDDKLLDLWSAGYTSSKIAKELGVSNSTVNDHLKVMV